MRTRSAPTAPAPCITSSHTLKPTSSPIRPATENVRTRPDSTASRAPGAMIVLCTAVCARTTAPRPFRSSRLLAITGHHDREPAAQPHCEAEQMQEEPEADHVLTDDRMAPSIGCRPPKPDSISCQWLIRSSPRRQQRKIGPVLAERIEVHQSRLEPLEHAADRLELLQVAVDPLRVARHILAGGHQLGGLAPVGAGAAGEDLEPAHRRAPGRVLRCQVLHDSAHQRQRAFGLRPG